jgi:hypothetical protein
MYGKFCQEKDLQKTPQNLYLDVFFPITTAILNEEIERTNAKKCRENKVKST